MSEMSPQAVFEGLLREAIDRDASDLFLLPGEPPVFRQHEGLVRAESNPLTAAEVVQIAESLMGHEAVESLGRSVGAVRRPYDLPGVASAGLCAARSRGDCTLSVRLLPRHIHTVTEIGAPQALVDLLESRQGLILVSGPMGCGKTTTALALVEHINVTRNVHICTVEEPGYTWMAAKRAIVQQRFVGLDVPDTLTGIRAAQEQDADVIYLSEANDVESLEACLAAAQSGRLVILVLHAPNPEGAVRAVLDAFPDELREPARKALAAALLAATSQCLLPRIGGKGRIPAYGLLVPDAQMRIAIETGEDFMRRSGPPPTCCRTFAQDVARRVAEGVVSEAAAKAALQAAGPNPEQE